MTWIVESDEWGPGPSIASADALDRIRTVLEESAIIVEHRFYRGASAPERMIFEAYKDFLGHVETRSRPGDSFSVWRYDEFCRDENALASGKLPDAHGRVPKYGPY